jgi:tetratricopeptide (TPR) repeat protein
VGIALAPAAWGARATTRAAGAAKPKPKKEAGAGDAGAGFILVVAALSLWFAVLLWPRVAIWRDEGTLYGSMLVDSPESPHVHAIIGGFRYKERDLERAAFHYRRAIQLAPEKAEELLLNLGAAEDEMGQRDSAFVHVRQLNALRPNYAPAWYALGNLYVRVDEPDSAILAYKESLRLMPALAQAENNMGAVHERMGRFEEALAAYRRSLQALPGYREATNNLRRLSAELGRPSGLDSLAGEAIAPRAAADAAR